MKWRGPSGHQTKQGAENDREKDRAAMVLGWLVIRFSPDQIVKDPVGCVEQIKAIMEGRRSDKTRANTGANA
jgi:very-short-patch-repair endonuclease